MRSFLVKNGLFNTHIIEGNNLVMGKWENKKPVGIFEINTPHLTYRGRYIEELEINVEGFLDFNNGSFYKGSIIRRNNEYYRHGQGTYTSGETIYTGQWNYMITFGHMIKTITIAYRKYTITYNGEFVNMEPVNDEFTFIGATFKGKIKKTKCSGVLRFDNGDIFEGNSEYIFPIDGKMIYANDTNLISLEGKWDSPDNFKKVFKNGSTLKNSIFTDKYGNEIRGITYDYLMLNVSIKYIDGSKYEGYINYMHNIFQSGLEKYYRHGFGSFTNTDGITFQCNWVLDEIKNNSKVIEILPHGKKLIYILKDGNKTGDGSIIQNSIITPVRWINNEPHSVFDTETMKTLKCPECREENSFNIDKNRILLKDINPKNICGICYENEVDTTLPICRHTFCRRCLHLM